MKKILGIAVLGLLLSGNAYAEQFEAHVKNYYNPDINFYGISKKNFEEAKKQAFEDCKKNAVEKNLDSKGCLLYALQSYTAWQTLTGQEYEEIFWEKEVAKFEKKIAEKSKKEKPFKLVQIEFCPVPKLISENECGADAITFAEFINRKSECNPNALCYNEVGAEPSHYLEGHNVKVYVSYNHTMTCEDRSKESNIRWYNLEWLNGDYNYANRLVDEFAVIKEFKDRLQKTKST